MIRGFISEKSTQNVCFNIEKTKIEIVRTAGSVNFYLNFVSIHVSF